MRIFAKNTKWEIDEGINPITGKVCNQYYYDKEEAIKVKLDSNKVKNYSGWLLIERDVRNIKEWLDLFVTISKEIFGGDLPTKSQMRVKYEDSKQSNLKAIMIAVVTTYGKLFAKAEGRKVKLDRTVYQQNDDQTEFHDFLIELRNRFAAHGGEHDYEYADLYLLLDPQKERFTPPIIASELSQPNSLPYNNIDIFYDMIEHLTDVIEGKIEKIDRSVMEGIISKGPDFWYDYADFET